MKPEKFMRIGKKTTFDFKSAGKRRLLLLLGLCLAVSASRGATFMVTTTNDVVAGSLRQAISNANTNPGPNTIAFNISGTKPFTISPNSVLPTINDSTTIDGSTEPGFAGTPVIELNGSNAGGGAVGLQMTNFCTVRGLAIGDFSAQGIVLNGASNIVAGNYIGTDITGTNRLANGNVGIWVQGSGNLVGGTNASDPNVISGNSSHGVYISNAGGNVVEGNLIGITPSGTGALGNGNDGVFVYGTGGNLIGGTNTAACNVISGNGGDGVSLYGATATGNVIQGNYIGLNLSGGGSVSNMNNGILLNGAVSNTIGGNVISGNRFSGIYLTNASWNVMWGNFVGTDAAGKSNVPNLFPGVEIFNAVGNTIGGTNAGAGNVISGNAQQGIVLTGGVLGTWIAGNLIGLSAAGTNALPNLSDGITLNGAVSNIIGGLMTAARNVISGNTANGVDMLLTADSFNVVCGNYIGTDITGRKAIGNGLSGTLVQACSNVIGGTVAGSGNVISGNGSVGVWLSRAGGTVAGNSVQGNFIGVDATGASSMANAIAGVGISSAAGNLIGGMPAGARNVISANNGFGVFLIGAGTTGNQLQGNFIGMKADGTNALGNLYDGINLENVSSNQIGGGAGNLVSANGYDGIYLTNSPWNVIQGNFVGTDLSGTRARGNANYGIDMQGSSTNQIGGSAAGARNLISANTWDGIYFLNSSWNLIQGNLIGTKADGTNALGNIRHNAEFDINATNNTLGGTAVGSGNVLAFAQTYNGSGYCGVRVRAGAFNNLVSGNSIFSNNGLGIDLGNYGVNTNVDCEYGVAAIAANAGQNYPVLSSAYTSAVTTEIRGMLDSGEGKTYALQFFASPTGDSLGYGEGQIFLGQTNLTLGMASCSSNFVVSLPVSVPAGWAVTATATDPNNNTSEFSAWTNVIPVPPLQLAVAGAGGNQMPQVSFSWTNNGGSFLLQQTFNLNPPAQWTTVTNLPVLSNGFEVVTLNSTNASAFYRLMSP
jgi:titin